MAIVTRNKRYSTTPLPFEEDLSRFAVPYIPEKFTREEIKFLRPFFSNVDKPVFVIQHLPEEVVGALSSRYSRATQSLRRLFLKEYIDPIIHPEAQKDWETLSAKEKKESEETKQALLEMIEILNNGGGIDKIVNIQRGRKFFDTWLAQYGDDSIAELGGIHMCIEGLSMVATKELQDKRVGISPLEKSTRYVQYWEKRSDGQYQYYIPGELKGTEFEKEYISVMDELFDTYSNSAEGYLDYIKGLYPQGSDETPRSFNGSRGAKRFDDIRDLLPFSTQTNCAFFGNGRAFEDLITRCLAHPLGEIRWLGQQICLELEKVVPSFVRRPQTERGAEAQLYRSNITVVRHDLAKKNLSKKVSKPKKWTSLVSFTLDAEIEVLATYLFSGTIGVSLQDVYKQVKRMGKTKRKALLTAILQERKFGKKDAQRQEMRFRKVPRAFENAHYLFELWARGGDYRDLQRHRQLTQDRQLFTTVWGYDLEKEVLKSPFIDEFKTVLDRADKFYRKVAKVMPEVAQYIVPFAYLQHWYIEMTAREIYWIVELRTGPQGRPHYRAICQDIAKKAELASPDLFQMLATDWNDYSLARRESEKKIDKKLSALGK